MIIITNILRSLHDISSKLDNLTNTISALTECVDAIDNHTKNISADINLMNSGNDWNLPPRSQRFPGNNDDRNMEFDDDEEYEQHDTYYEMPVEREALQKMDKEDVIERCIKANQEMESQRYNLEKAKEDQHSLENEIAEYKDEVRNLSQQVAALISRCSPTNIPQ